MAIIRQSVSWDGKVLGPERKLGSGSTPNTAGRQNGSQRMGGESRDLREFWINEPNRIPLRLDWGGQTSLENQWRTSNCCGVEVAGRSWSWEPWGLRLNKLGEDGARLAESV